MAPGSTIYSLSSASGRAGVAVIRISGPQADAALRALAGRLPEPRVASLLALRDEAGALLDRALVLRFPAGASFTGESVVELQVHGGRAVVRAVLEALSRQTGLRLAERGEFTRRALENGRLDLTQVEALSDLIDAETEQQRRQALHGFGGALGARVGQWRDLLLQARALVAAEIDFSDEGDVGEHAAAAVDALLLQLAIGLEAALADADRGRIVADGFRIAIVGPPNVGKSTLLNALAGSDVAIVTEHAGTTRDILEIRLDVGGFAVVLQDTAGLRRDAVDPVERIGIERTKRAILQADLLLELGHGDQCEWTTPSDGSAPSIRVRTKTDLGIGAGGEDVGISAMTGQGLDSLLKRITELLHSLAPPEAEPALIAQTRQRIAIDRARFHLAEALLETRIEFKAEHLLDADRALASVVGAIGVEEILGAIFNRFCVGK